MTRSTTDKEKRLLTASKPKAKMDKPILAKPLKNTDEPIVAKSKTSTTGPRRK